MKSFADNLDAALAAIPGADPGEIARARRARQVRGYWAQLVEQPILNHTNAVFLFTKDGRRELHVYVDESIYAAELNNRRELLRMLMLDRFGERVDQFDIHISRGKYKQVHPFAPPAPAPDSAPPAPLDDAERARLQAAAATVPDPALRAKFARAMQADLEWKKGQRAAETRN